MRFPFRSDRNAELDAEIASHIALSVQERIARGESAESAHAAALREFGNVALIKETTREMWRWNALAQIAQDVRYAARTLRRSAPFTVAAVATLALGIAAATVIFSVTDHIAFRKLPYPNADRLFVAQEVIEEMRDRYPVLSANASHYLAWKRSCTVCNAVEAVRPVSVIRMADGVADQPGTVRVSAGFLPLLGATLQRGRLFTAADYQSGNRVVIVSNGYWRATLGGDSTVVGKTLQLNGEPWQIAGILTNEFSFPKGSELGPVARLPATTDLFIPLVFTQAERASPGAFDYSVIARLAPGATLAQAHAQLAAVQASLSEGNSDGMTFQISTTGLRQQIVGASGNAMVFLLAAVGSILLIVCVNLANLLLARHASRARESAIRVALGAKPARLVRQALTESLLLAAVGGALGILISQWGLAVLLQLAPADTPRLSEVRLDGRIIAVAAAVSLLTGLAFGVFPALRFGRVNPADVLKAGGRTMTDARSAGRTRAILIASQVGLSAILLYATGLFLSSFVRVLNVDKGFVTTEVLALDVTLPRAVYFTPVQRTLFHDQVLERLAALPGVKASAVTSFMPLEGEMSVDMLSRENDARPAVERPLANLRYVSPSYFGTLGVRISRGRFIQESDRGRNVVVLSEQAANKLWPGENPIGKQVVPGSNDPIAEVVGTVPDVRTSSMEQPGSLTVYLPYWQRPPLVATLLLSTSTDSRNLILPARKAIAETGSAVPVAHVRTMQQIVDTALAARRFQLALMVVFALSALVTASMGIYGIISHGLSKRANEIGIRLALGAKPAHVHRMILWETLHPAAYGLAAGVGISVALGRLFQSLLFEVRPSDPLTMTVVAALLLVVGATACYVPARRSTNKPVLLALRAD